MSVVIGEFDCDALTTTVTLDTSGANNGTPFDISVIRRAAGTTDQVSRQLVFLEPDVKETVTVALAPDAYNWVFVSGGNINANQDGPCGSYVLDPRATVAELDCTALQPR